MSQIPSYDDIIQRYTHDYENKMTPYTFPLAWACKKGNLNECICLYNNSSANDVTKVSYGGYTPMFIACYNGHLSVCKWLFEVGAAKDVTKMSNFGYTPMFWACSNGNLPLCKWLFEVGASKDIIKPTKTNDNTPMFRACSNGHLSVCKWLFEVGASADISKTDNLGNTPMYTACFRGHLSVCKWLIEVGAAKDIFKASKDNRTPIQIACLQGHLSVIKWLILNGALKHHEQPFTLPKKIVTFHRELFAWSNQIINEHNTFRLVFLPGTLCTEQRKCSPHLWILNSHGMIFSRMFKVLIAEFAGVEYGTHLGNVRKFAEAEALANS